MASIGNIIDGVADQLQLLKDTHRHFKQAAIKKSYVYTNEFRFPQIKNWGFFIRPGITWKLSTERLGNRMEERYFVEIVIILKVDSTKMDSYFEKGLQDIESWLRHNTLNDLVRPVGNNVNFELLDMGDVRVMTAILTYSARDIIST